MDYYLKEQLIKEINISAVRSSGPGGQNVNKVNTKVELRFNIEQSKALNTKQKLLIQLKLNNRINDSGELVLSDQSSRSQLKNKNAAIERFILLIEKALRPVKKRIATKPTKSSKLKRLDNKKQQSLKKQLRKRDF